MIRDVAKKAAKMISKTNEGNDIVADDHGLFKQYTDKDLRRVFSGLVQGSK